MGCAAIGAATLLAGCDRGDAAPAATSPPDGAVEANAVVEYIVDGDTVDFVIDGREERVRLIGVDTPETRVPDVPVECYGPEATSFIAELLPVGSAVRIERDTVNRDDYGRLLGYVYRAGDGVFVNYELIRQGYATPLSIAPNTSHADLFVDAARAAEAADAGLWATCRE